MNQPIIISDYPGLSPEGQKLLQEIQADIAGLKEDRQRLETDEGEVRSASPASLTERHLKLARNLPLRRLELLRRELVIRYRMQDAFFPLLKKDRWAHYEKLLAEQERAYQEVVNKLLSIGYLDGFLPGTEIPSIDSLMVGKHPSIFSLGQEIDTAFHHAHDNSHEQHNRESIAELLRTMEEAKQRALNSVA